MVRVVIVWMACSLAVLCCEEARATGPQGREPPPDDNFGTIAEGHTAKTVGGPIEAGYRMFSVPDFDMVCQRARADAVATLRSSAPVRLRVGQIFEPHRLRIDARDVAGRLVPRVPISIELEYSEVVDVPVADSTVRPLRPGTVRFRVRTICDAPGDAIVITADVVR